MSLAHSFSGMFFGTIQGEKIFIWISLFTFIGNFSILDYYNTVDSRYNLDLAYLE